MSQDPAAVVTLVRQFRHLVPGVVGLTGADAVRQVNTQAILHTYLYYNFNVPNLEYSQYTPQ